MKRVKRAVAVAVNVLGLAAAVAVAVVAGVHFERQGPQVPRPHTAPSPPKLSYLGIYEPSSPGSYAGVEQFSRLVGTSPQIAVYYSSWFEPFQSAFARAAHAHGAIPMVQMEPSGISLAKIAAGQYDTFVASYAREVRSYGQPVILSFGHEMNADWYSWSYGRTESAVFVAAWQHIHNLFTAEGARNVTWLWAVNVVGGPQVRPIKAWWPGSAYVDWVGIDGHYFQLNNRFSQLFGATLTQIRRLTRDPVLISESGIGPYVGIDKITDLFAGAQAHGLLGVVWFDVAGHNLRIENDPAAIALFQQAVSRYYKPTTSGQPTKAVAGTVQGGSK
jgi:mannan endo-1,4-beta-mannosidase